MISFHVPLSMKEEGGKDNRFYTFAVGDKPVMLFAGSRNNKVSDQTCRDLVSGFSRLGFNYVVGCAGGVDASFRSALAGADYRDKSLCAVAYPYRLKKITDLSVKLVVPDTVNPHTAPRVRTLWMADVADIAVVFPDDPVSGDWGKGSTVAINAMIKQGKPVFVATGKKPNDNGMVKVLPTSLFGTVKGYFIIKKGVGYISPATCKSSGWINRSNSLKIREVACPALPKEGAVT